MQVIVNKEELVEPLAKRILMQAYKKKTIQYTDLDFYLDKIRKRLANTRLLDINFEEVNNLINRALVSHTDQLIVDYKKQYRPLVNWLVDKFPSLAVDSQQLLEWYTDPEHTGFIKNIAKQNMCLQKTFN